MVALMSFKDAKPCGAKCRGERAGQLCKAPAMQNGRCRMHGGVFYKREVHGGRTLRAIAERKQERKLLREMRTINAEIEKHEKQQTV